MAHCGYKNVTPFLELYENMFNYHKNNIQRHANHLFFICNFNFQIQGSEYNLKRVLSNV